jgi:hypothetical protein
MLRVVLLHVKASKKEEEKNESIQIAPAGLSSSACGNQMTSD